MHMDFIVASEISILHHFFVKKHAMDFYRQKEKHKYLGVTHRDTFTCHVEQGHDDKVSCSFNNKIIAEITGELILYKAVFFDFSCFITKQHQQLKLLWKSHFHSSVLLLWMVKIQATIMKCCWSLFSAWRRTNTHSTPCTSQYHQSTTWSRRHATNHH